jgi:hypothetical protein
MRRIGDNKRNRIAYMAHKPFGKHRARRIVARRTIDIRERQSAGNAAQIVGREIGRGQDQAHTLDGGGGFNIDTCDARICMRAPENDGVQLAGQIDVVGIATATDQQPLIFHALERLGLTEFGQLFKPSLLLSSAQCSSTRSP